MSEATTVLDITYLRNLLVKNTGRAAFIFWLCDKKENQQTANARKSIV